MQGATVLVTGGTGGIGLATAAGLAGLGARVGIVGRDPDRAARAADTIRRAAAGAVKDGARDGAAGSVDVFLADVSVQADVRRLSADVLDAYPRLDVLVNNAGGYWAHRHVTVDGLERTFAVNHLAPYLLTRLLLGRLSESAPARVVTVSSGAQSMGRIDFDDLQGRTRYRGQRAYNQSKLANVLHPGVVDTGFGREDSGRWMGLLLPLVRPFLKTPAEGAATSIHLASSPELAGTTGRYFVRCAPRKSSARSYDEQAARRLWDVSAELTGLPATRTEGVS
jgi:NADP-dependent 3-hydroxy acid dehydrogenase YdfG